MSTREKDTSPGVVRRKANSGTLQNVRSSVSIALFFLLSGFFLFALLAAIEHSRKAVAVAGVCLVAVVCIIVFLTPVRLPEFLRPGGNGDDITTATTTAVSTESTSSTSSTMITTGGATTTTGGVPTTEGAVTTTTTKVSPPITGTGL